MRFIKKTEVPQFFHDDTSGLSVWDDYLAEKKRRLKQHILDNEQNYLCVYCETRIDVTTSHLEHIRPKSISPSTLTFDYNNISVSCNGDCHNRSGDNHAYHCGHRKDKIDTRFDETKFLNLVEIDDLRDYFEYTNEKNQWMIVPSEKSPDNANYMIDTLRLNDNGLPLARKKALQAFIKTMSTIKDKEVRLKNIKAVLKNESIPYISFLKYRHKSLLDK